MNLRNTCAVLGLVSFAFSLSAQEPAPAPAPPAAHWQQQTQVSLGFNSYHGNSDSLSLTFRIDSTATRGIYQIVTNVDTDFSQSSGRSIVDREKLDTALRRSFVKHPKYFSMFHTWFEHNRTAGVKFRGAAGPGFGAHVIDNAKTKLTLEGGLAVTFENQIEDDTYPTFFFDPTHTWTINRQNTLRTFLKFRQNLDDTEDRRFHAESNLYVQITRRVGVQVGATIDYDSEPVRGHETTDVQTYTMFSFNLSSGVR